MNTKAESEGEAMLAAFRVLHDRLIFEPPPGGWESLEVFVDGTVMPMSLFVAAYDKSLPPLPHEYEDEDC